MIQKLLRLIEPLRGADRSVPSRRMAVPTASFDLEATLMNELSGLHVYVVDDDKDVRNALGVLLKGWGCTPFISASGSDMIAMLKKGRPLPDAIIIDYCLPDSHNGVEIINLIHSQYSAKIPALLVTADYEIDHLSAAKAGEYTVLFKPVEPARLRAWLRNSTRRSIDRPLTMWV